MGMPSLLYLMTNKTDTIVLETALKLMSERFDEFLGACIDDKGKPQAPTMQILMKSKGYLPPYCTNAFKKRIK